MTGSQIKSGMTDCCEFVLYLTMDGFFLIDKPAGYTSFDVCACVKKHLNIKKVGHTGTLDPFATGLLVVATGKGTKFIPYLEKAKKTYRATIVLGKTSETLDPESEIIRLTDEQVKRPTEEQIYKVIEKKFFGKIEQVPPKFSALKIDGKRAYDLARKGEDFEIPKRATEVIRCEVVSYNFPKLEVELEVAAGFYVRSFARDIGYELLKDVSAKVRKYNSGGYCSVLRRLKVGGLSVEDAEPIDGLTIPIDPQYILADMQHIEIPTGKIQDFIIGKAFDWPGVQGEKVLVLCGGKTVGIGEFKNGQLQPRAVV